MTDSPTSRMKLRQQSQGSNTNTWGDDKINEAFRNVDRSAKGYEAIAMTGETTLSWSNYIATNSGQVAVLKLTGSLSSATNLIVPSVEWVWDIIWNTTGQTITVKTSAGTGVAIPNGRKAAVFCDAADCYFAVPNYIGDDITEANNRDLMDKAAVEAAIATSTIPAAAGTILISATDTTAGYSGTKFVEGTGIDLSISSAGGGSETIVITSDTVELEEFLALTGKITATLSSGTTAMTDRRRYRISAAATGTLPTMAAGSFVIVEFTVGSGVTGTVARNSQTIDGAAADDTYLGTGGDSGPVIRYQFSSAGAVTSEIIGGVPI